MFCNYGFNEFNIVTDNKIYIHNETGKRQGIQWIAEDTPFHHIDNNYKMLEPGQTEGFTFSPDARWKVVASVFEFFRNGKRIVTMCRLLNPSPGTYRIEDIINGGACGSFEEWTPINQQMRRQFENPLIEQSLRSLC